MCMNMFISITANYQEHFKSCDICPFLAYTFTALLKIFIMFYEDL